MRCLSTGSGPTVSHSCNPRSQPGESDAMVHSMRGTAATRALSGLRVPQSVAHHPWSNARAGDRSRPPAATWPEVFAYFLPEIVTLAASLVLALVQLRWLTQSQQVPTVLGVATTWAVILTSVLLGSQLLPADRLHRRASGAVTTLARVRLARVRLAVRLAFAGLVTHLVGRPWRTCVASIRMRALTNSWPAPLPLQLARFVAELRAPGSPQRCAEAGTA